MCSAKSRSAKRRRSGGFSLIEAVVTAGLVSVGLLGLSASTLLITKTAKAADNTSAATALATKQLELLRSMPLDADPQHKPGNYDGGTYQPNGNQGGPIAITWVVSDRDVPRPGLKTITVSANWGDSAAASHTMAMSGYVRCSTVPCRVY